MHIVYLDESGTHAEARYFVVAGLVVFERNTYFLARGLDQLQSKYFPDYPEPVAFHASSLRAPEGRVPKPFDRLTQPDRWKLISEIYQVIAESHARIIAVAMEKAAIIGDPYERGFEEIVSRFDYMLGRILRDRGEDQRGLIVVAESSYRENLELLARRIATQGHRWGDIHNLADIPYFAPAKSTRLLQLADFVSNAVFGRYESGYAKDFDRIASHFDQDAGRIHGLVHLARDRQDCYCPACVQRRAAPRLDVELQSG
tara:strand:+ start:891 stop:1664 length:774 start_codon:yes stop_codon:yes gene_type:complete